MRPCTVQQCCTQVSKLPSDVRDGRSAPQDMEQEALKRSPGWQLYHKWTFRLELAQQARSGSEYMRGCDWLTAPRVCPCCLLQSALRMLPSIELLYACTQVAAAVSYMHANDVIHLDLTSQNLLVADGGNAKVLSACSRSPVHQAA